jgi:hypothetical protein
MTEYEWLNSDNPHTLLAGVAEVKQGPALRWMAWLHFGRAPNPSRKALLFAVACCREMESLLTDERSRNALTIAEKYADGQASRKEWRLGKWAADAAAFDASGPQLGVGGWLAVAQARAADSVAAVFDDEDPANLTAASAREAFRAAARKDTRSRSQSIKAAGRLESVSLGSLALAAPLALDVPPEQVAWDTVCKHQCDYLRDLFGNPFRPVTSNERSARCPNAIALAKTIGDACSFHQMPDLAAAMCAEGIKNPEVLEHCRQPHHIRGCWVIDWLLGK